LCPFQKKQKGEKNQESTLKRGREERRFFSSGRKKRRQRVPFVEGKVELTRTYKTPRKKKEKSVVVEWAQGKEERRREWKEGLEHFVTGEKEMNASFGKRVRGRGSSRRSEGREGCGTLRRRKKRI